AQITGRGNAVDAKQGLIVRVNGNKARKEVNARRALEQGWQTIEFPIEKGWLHLGENTITFETTGKSNKKVAFSWIRLRVVKPPADQDPLLAATFDGKADAIELADRASLTWYVSIPEG